MSTTGNIAMYATLTGSAPLVAAVGKDPRDQGPAIGYQYEDEVPPAYPCVVYSELTDSPMKGVPVTIDYEIYELRIYTTSRNANAINTIFDLVDPLLNRQWIVGPGTETTHNHLYQVLRMEGGSPFHWDSKLQAAWGAWLYKFTHGRG